jgi:hypothetical protein
MASLRYGFAVRYGLAVAVTRNGERVKMILVDGATEIPDPAHAAPTDTLPLHFDIPLDAIEGYAGRSAPVNAKITAQQARDSIANRRQIIFDSKIELNDLDLLDGLEKP